MAVCLDQYKSAIERKRGELDLVSSQLATAKDYLATASKRIVAIAEAQKIIQDVAVATQSQIVYRIEDIVNKVIQTVFPEYSFELSYDVKRGKSEASLNFYCNGELVDIMEDSGGVTDMATMGLRFALWSLTNKHDTMILDEHLKFVSPDLQQRASDVLLEVCHTLGIQVIIVSHINAIKERADHTVSVEKRGKYSYVV